MALLTEKRNQVAKLEKQLKILNEKLDEAIKEQTRLQDSVDLCNSKLWRAQKLIGMHNMFELCILFSCNSFITYRLQIKNIVEPK